MRMRNVFTLKHTSKCECILFSNGLTKIVQLTFSASLLQMSSCSLSKAVSSNQDTISTDPISVQA